MKAIFFIVLLFTCLVMSHDVNRPNIIPNVKEVSYGNQTLSIQSCISILSNSVSGDFVESLKQMYNSPVFGKSSNLVFGSECPVSISITVENPDIMMPKGFDSASEWYSLNISSEGQITIDSNYQVGVLRAMETFAQLVNRKNGVTIKSLPISINDQPRYPYRGFMLDVSREYYPISSLKQIIDGLRMTKINHMHLHLTDDDSIPLQFPSYPDMVKHTAFSEEEIYTAEDMKDLIKYANDRGIKIIPEVDIPGHIRSLGNDPSKKHLLTCYDKNYKWKMQDGQYIVGGPPSAVINPTLDETYEFIANIVKDLNEMFSDAEFLHFGGDEVNTSGCWTAVPEIKQFMDENNMTTGTELFAYFNQRLRKTIDGVLKDEKREIAHWTNSRGLDIKWDEGSLLQYWGLEKDLPELIKAYPGHKHILSLQDKFYFDCGTGNKYGDGLCDPYDTWAMGRIFEPTDYYGDSDMLLGGEAPLWGELSTPYNMFNKVWPRLGVMSDIFWGPKIDGPINWGNVVADLVSFRNYVQDNGIPGNKISSR